MMAVVGCGLGGLRWCEGGRLWARRIQGVGQVVAEGSVGKGSFSWFFILPVPFLVVAGCLLGYNSWSSE